MLPDPASSRQVEGSKAPPPAGAREPLDAINARRSLRDQPLEEERDKLGIEDADPRWSKRELVLKRLDLPPGDPDAALRLAGDASDFRGQPADPFETLIQRREARRRRARRGTPEIAIKLETGLAPLDAALGGLGGHLYAISGPLEPCRALAHQIACEVAREHPVVFASHGQTARELTLQALGRLAGDRAPGDLARARAVANAFRPVRENIAIVELGPDDTVARLRSRLRGLLARRGVRHGLVAVDDLVALATGGRESAAPRPTWAERAVKAASKPSPPASPGARGRQDPGVPGRQDPGARGRQDPGVPGKMPAHSPGQELRGAVPAACPPPLAPEVFEAAAELARMAFQLGIPGVVVLPADLAAGESFAWPADLPEPVRLVLSGTAPELTLTVHRPQGGQLRPRAGNETPPELSVTFDPRRRSITELPIRE